MKSKLIGIGLLVLVIANLVGWSFYNLLKNIAKDFLSKYGIVDPNQQLLVIIFSGIIILYLLGKFSLKEILD